MSLFSAAALENAGAGDLPALRVSTKYMETFQQIQALSSGSEIHVFQNQQGALDLYSVGTDEMVYRLRRNNDAVAPYEETVLGITATQLYPFAPAGGSADTPWIFGLNPKKKLTLARYVDGVGYVQQVTQPAKATENIYRFLGVRGVTGRIYINVQLESGHLATNYYDPLADKWGGDHWAPVKGPDGQDVVVKDLSMAGNNPLQSALFAIGEDDEVLFAEESFSISKLRKLNKKATHLAVVTDGDNLLNIFAVERNTGLLWRLKQKKHSTNGIQFDDWSRVDLSQHVQLTRVRANLRFDNVIEVFGIDASGMLQETNQFLDARGKISGWRPLFPLGNAVGSAIFTVGRTGNGYSEAYSVTQDNELYRFWQSPQTARWFSEHLQAPSTNNKMAHIPTHATEIIVADDQGVPAPFTDVTINTPFLTTLWVNGSAYRCSLVDPVTLKTGANGKIVVHQRANALAAATLLVACPRTAAGSPIKVEPNAELQERLSKITGPEILNAKDGSGQYLLPADKRKPEVADSIAEITKQSMRIAQADEAARAIAYKFASRRVVGFEPKANLRALGNVAWEIDFSGGYPRYNELSLESVAAYRAAKTDSALVGGFLGIDWGAVWNAFKNGVKWVVDGIVRIVVEIVEGVGRVLFEIAGKVFEAVLEFAQQAFDFVEGIWNWLKVKFEQLYEWLAFIFNFKDFVRTAEGVKHTIGVFLDFSVDAVEAVKKQVEAGFDTVKHSLDSIVNDLLQTLNGEGDPSMGAYFKRHEADQNQLHANDHNLFLNAWSENQDRILDRSGQSATLFSSSALESSLQSLLEKMEQLTKNFQFDDGKQAFDEAFAYFDNIGQQPNRALQLLLSGVVKLMESVALFALDAAKGVVSTLFDLVKMVIQLFREALFAEWEIPVLSQLYALFTGEKLTVTPVDVIAYITAIPMTLFSKVVLGRAPWPDDAALDKYRQTFTVDWLKSRIGLSTAEAVAVGNWDPQWRTNFLSGYCCMLFVRAFAEPGQVMSHAAGKGLGKAAIVPVALRFLSTCFTAPWALSAQAGAPSCTPGEPGFAVTTWICQMAFGPILSGLIVKFVPDGQPKIYLSELRFTLWGAAQLIMVAWQFTVSTKTTETKLAFSRAMTNIIPAQTLRFLCVPALNKGDYMIPAAILAVLTFVGYLGSFGVAIAEINVGEAELLPAE